MSRFILVFLVFFTSCADFSILEKDQQNLFFFENTSNEKPEFSDELKIATFNIKFGFCQSCDPFTGEIGGGHEQLDSIAELINSIDADIISLQEVGLDYDVTVVQNQAAYLAQKTNMNFAYGMDAALQSRETLFINGFRGNAILSKYEIINVENLTIRYIDYYNQNHALKATIKLNEETEVVFLTSHFASGSTDQEKNIQISQVNNIVSQINNPYFFAGDLNIPYLGGREFISQLEESFINSVDELIPEERDEVFLSGTFLNGAILDYIFTDPSNFSVQSGRVIVPQTGSLSDHYLYTIDVVRR